MSNKHTLFYRGKQAVSVNFSAGEISSDGAVVYLEKLERKHGIIKRVSQFIPDDRDPKRVRYSRYSQLKQRVFMMIQGYEDTNDVTHLKNDPIFRDVLQGDYTQVYCNQDKTEVSCHKNNH